MHPAVTTGITVLGLDSATDACSAAVLCDGTLVAHRFECMRRGHAEVLMALVQDVMQRAGLTFDALDLIATTVGPGGFTGLRIGLASARGLALAGQTPIVGVTTLEAVARAQPIVGMPTLIALDSKRDDIYVQTFDSGRFPLCEPKAALPAEIETMLPAGDIAVGGNASDIILQAMADRIPPLHKHDGPVLPDAAVVATIGAERMPAHASSRTAPPSPLYLRPPDAMLPSGRRK